MDSFIRIKGRQPRKHGGMNLFSNVKQTRNFASKQWSQQAVQKAWPGRPVWRGLMPRTE
jgi:hypothetical protein